MATPAIVVVVVATIISVSVLAITVVFLIANIKQLIGTLGRLQQELEPGLAKLTAGTEETQRRLEAVSGGSRARPGDDAAEAG